jgi:hypothetical protein
MTGEMMRDSTRSLLESTVLTFIAGTEENYDN